jgi:predicted Rossmann fold flavoprotein
MKVGIIGGGAAGFFAALSVKEHHPDFDVVIVEKTTKLLSKVKVSGGGRCNVTHACFENKELAGFYPRGQNQLRKAFDQFNVQSTIDWFAKRNIALETLPDNCIFPKSNTSQTIIDCFMNEAKKQQVEVKMKTSINSIEKKGEQFILVSELDSIVVDQVILTSGGQPKIAGLNWIEKLGHAVVTPVPSLFTFNMPENPIRELMGNVTENTTVKIVGSKLIARGPLLITHWGMSGPAILKLSAWGARILAEKVYKFTVIVNWLDQKKENELVTDLDLIMQKHGSKMIGNFNPFPITKRLWHFLLEKMKIAPDVRWKDIGKKGIHKLIHVLLSDEYEVSGKTTFKEEFVTAGGVDLKQVNFKTMESKRVEGLFFAGEILDIDGITGGFNFQAAWTTAWIAGKHVGQSC